MDLLIIDNHDSFTFNLVQLVEQSKLCNFKVVAVDLLEPELPGAFDKILISPGPGFPAGNPRLGEVIAQWGLQKSVLGICLGHQAIAEAFGGRLVNLAEVRHGISVAMGILDLDEYLFKGLENPFRGGLYHSWVVSERDLPEELKVTVRSEEGMIMAISHKKYDIRGLQFHPESVMTPGGSIIINNWLKY